MEAQDVEGELHDRFDRLGHDAPTGERLPHPVTERSGLRDAALDTSERQASHQHGSLAVEHEVGVAGSLPRIQSIATQPQPVGTAVELVRGPARLPGRQEPAAAFAQGPPCLVIGGARQAQKDVRPRQHRLSRRLDPVEEGHGGAFA